MLAGIAAAVFQHAPSFAVEQIKPKWSRISPVAGWKRLFGAPGLVEFGKALFKFAAIGLVCVVLMSANRSAVVDVMFADPGNLPEIVLSLVMRLVSAVCTAIVLMVVADILWSRFKWRADLRMTRQEVKDEIKQSEGDPLVKSRLRSLARDRARRRMIAAVPNATVIIANPTHYAIALKYDRAKGGAPLVVAKGVDLVALRIREIACAPFRARSSRTGRWPAPSTKPSKSTNGSHRSSIVRSPKSSTSSTPARFAPLPADGTFLAKQEANRDRAARLRRRARRRPARFPQRAGDDQRRRHAVATLQQAARHAGRPHRLLDGARHEARPADLRNHAEIDFDWGAAPSVALGMELRDDRMTAFFHVVFGGDHVGIDISGIHFTDAAGAAARRTCAFSPASSPTPATIRTTRRRRPEARTASFRQG